MLVSATLAVLRAQRACGVRCSLLPPCRIHLSSLTSTNRACGLPWELASGLHQVTGHCLVTLWTKDSPGVFVGEEWIVSLRLHLPLVWKLIFSICKYLLT